jgi:hypothetical protein
MAGTMNPKKTTPKLEEKAKETIQKPEEKPKRPPNRMKLAKRRK